MTIGEQSRPTNIEKAIFLENNSLSTVQHTHNHINHTPQEKLQKYIQ